jgi:hypothetical protein
MGRAKIVSLNQANRKIQDIRKRARRRSFLAQHVDSFRPGGSLQPSARSRQTDLPLGNSLALAKGDEDDVRNFEGPDLRDYVVGTVDKAGLNGLIDDTCILWLELDRHV